MRHKGHIRQRSPGSFEIRYELGADPLTGKRKTITTTFRGDRKQAEKEMRRLLRSIDTEEHIEQTKIKVGEFLIQWLDNMRSQISPKTHERYTQIVQLYLIPTFGGSLLPKLTPLAIQNAYNVWETSGRRDGKSGGLAPRSRLSIHRVFKQALKDAVRLQLILRNPADFIKAPRAKKAAITTLTVEQSATLLDAIRGMRLYWLVLLALTTGMRRGEILALRWKNVDFEKKTVRIVESLEQTKKGIRFKAPKTERTRAVILPEYAVEQLAEWKEKQKEELEKSKIAQTEDMLVCAGRLGEPLWPTSATHEFIKAVSKLPTLPRVRFHDLRDSHATQLLAAGIHPKIAQERLGHSTITTTLDLYSHATDTMQDDAASKLDTALRFALKSRKAPAPGPGYPRPPIEMLGETTFYFATNGIEDALQKAREAAGAKDIKIGGGVETVKQYIQAGYVDEIHLAIAPVVLGQGEALFSGVDLHALGYRTAEHVPTDRATHIVLTK